MTLRLKLYKCNDKNWVSEAASSRMAQSWLRDSQIAVKKTASVFTSYDVTPLLFIGLHCEKWLKLWFSGRIFENRPP